MNFVQPIREPEQIDAIEDLLKKLGQMWYLIWLVGIYAGLRCGDILQLRVGDVRDQTHIKLKEQKTGKVKELLIHPKLKQSLKEYIKGKPDWEVLFPSREGKNKPLTTTRVYQVIKEVAKEAGIQDTIGTHSMRKTFGYWFYDQYRRSNQKGPVFALAFLREWFGHTSEAITARYIGLNRDIFDQAVRTLRIGTKRGKRTGGEE
jgi:integrase